MFEQVRWQTRWWCMGSCETQPSLNCLLNVNMLLRSNIVSILVSFRRCGFIILTSQGLPAHGFRDPGSPVCAESFVTWWQNDTLSQSQLLHFAYQRIRQCVNINEFLKSWPALLESPGMLGGCQPITLPLLSAVTGLQVALLGHRGSSLIINDDSFKKFSAQAGFPGCLKPCAKTLACEDVFHVQQKNHAVKRINACLVIRCAHRSLSIPPWRYQFHLGVLECTLSTMHQRFVNVDLLAGELPLLIDHLAALFKVFHGSILRTKTWYEQRSRVMSPSEAFVCSVLVGRYST